MDPNQNGHQRVGRDELLGATVLPWERVELPQLGKGKFVYVQGLSGTERDRFEQSLVNRKGTRRDNIRARLAVRCIVDQPGGSRVYSDADIERVGLIGVHILQPIWNAAQRLCAFSDEDIEELGQASATAQAGSDSPTTLPPDSTSR